MTPIQQMLLGVGAKKKTYVDDVFSTFLYEGNGSSGSSQSINNGIDLAGEGGLVWFKPRESADEHELIDTVRGRTKRIRSDSNEAEGNISTGTTYDLTSFNNNGFSLGAAGSSKVNWNGEDLASWTFRKAPGFFDVVTYTGDGTDGRTISHSLGCIPGMILFKRTDGQFGWYVYHRGIGETEFLRLDTDDGQGSSGGLYNTAPTSSTITLGNNAYTNGDGNTYVAYIFAGGESAAAEARCVGFNGANSYLTLDDHDDFTIGTNWTAECYFKPLSLNNYKGVMGQWGTGNPSWILEFDGGILKFYYKDSSSNTQNKTVGRLEEGSWHHVAISKEGSNTRIFLDGALVDTVTDFPAMNATSQFQIGYGGNGVFNGRISNVRIVKGTALYTTSFRPSIKPLTNVTNTVLLCCNNSSTTGSTVAPGTITSNGGNAAALTDSPFDDPASHAFGEAKESIIKCGGYTGNGDATNSPDVNVGWEPQWLLIKRANGQGDWVMVDNMRGWFANTSETPHLRANSTNAEASTTYYRVKHIINGFKPTTTDNGLNGNGNTYIYVAIRFPDGYVGKPAEDATKYFAMDTGNGSTTIPAYDSNFPVDFGLDRQFNSSGDWFASARKYGPYYLRPNENYQRSGASSYVWDSSTGYVKGSWADSGYQAWMFRRHAGLDTVVYDGNGINGRAIPHSMNQVPELMIVKKLDDDENWTVYHTGLTNSNYILNLNTNAAQDDYSSDPPFKSTPTATHFEIGNNSRVNTNNKQYLALLFSSVSGISKVGSYSGSGSSRTITTGFQPRFLFIKGISNSRDWQVLDTTRGWGSGNDNRLWFNLNTTQSGAFDVGAPTSTGFTIADGDAKWNASDENYIYYAHA